MTNRESFEQKLMVVLSETFESLFFEEVVLESVEKVNKAVAIEDGSWWAKIQVQKPFLADFLMVIRKDLMIQYTEAAFGMLADEMPEDTQVLDNLGELMNTICGRIMASYLPSDTSFSLSLPELGDGTLPDLQGEFRALNCNVGDNLVFLMVPEKFWEKNNFSSA